MIDGLLANEPFTEREAWAWLNAHDGPVLSSERDLGLDWKWSRGHVRRFLDRLHEAGVIIVKRDRDGTAITVAEPQIGPVSGPRKPAENKAKSDMPAQLAAQQPAHDHPPLDGPPSLSPCTPSPSPPYNPPPPNQRARDEFAGQGELLDDAPKRKRATRLPDDWTLSSEWRKWAIEQAGLDPERVRIEADKFADYWRAKAKDATKLDWFATWRNWCRNLRTGYASTARSPDEIAAAEHQRLIDGMAQGTREFLEARRRAAGGSDDDDTGGGDQGPGSPTGADGGNGAGGQGARGPRGPDDDDLEAAGELADGVEILLGSPGGRAGGPCRADAQDLALEPQVPDPAEARGPAQLHPQGLPRPAGHARASPGHAALSGAGAGGYDRPPLQ